MSCAKRAAIIEASFPTLSRSFFSLLSISLPRCFSTMLGESIHAKPHRDVLENRRWCVRRSVARAGGCMRFYHLHPAPSFTRVERSALHRPSRISKPVKDSPRSSSSRKRHLYFRRSRAPAACQQNNISRNLPRSNET